MPALVPREDVGRRVHAPVGADPLHHLAGRVIEAGIRPGERPLQPLQRLHHLQARRVLVPGAVAEVHVDVGLGRPDLGDGPRLLDEDRFDLVPG